jgi:hypothetical protein
MFLKMSFGGVMQCGFRRKGWTNVQWFEHEQSVMRELRHNDVFDHVLSGEQSVASVAEEVLSLGEDRRTS